MYKVKEHMFSLQYWAKLTNATVNDFQSPCRSERLRLALCSSIWG